MLEFVHNTGKLRLKLVDDTGSPNGPVFKRTQALRERFRGGFDGLGSFGQVLFCELVTPASGLAASIEGNF
jgi:hypothetical protein